MSGQAPLPVRAALAALLLALAAGCRSGGERVAPVSPTWGEERSPSTSEAAPVEEDGPGLAAWAELHRICADPDAEGWTEALGVLRSSGDGFTLLRLQAIDPEGLDTVRRRALGEARGSISARVGETDDDAFVAGIATMLDRSAWADLADDPIAGELVPWTRETIADRLGSAEVRAEVARIAHEHLPTSEPPVDARELERRVRQYATHILRLPVRG
jgi:hypothetical protein